MKIRPDADHSWPSVLGNKRWLTLHEKLRELKATLKSGNLFGYTPDTLKALIASLEFIAEHEPPEMRPQRKRKLRRNRRMGQMEYGTERALEFVSKGDNPHAAALKAGVAPATVYLALKRMRSVVR